MSLITYTGGAESNSFVTVSWAEDYLTEIYGSLSTNWSSLATTALKEHRLILAAEMMGWLPLRGRRAYRYQRLPFPRDCQRNPRVLPEEAKKAQALIAHDVVDLMMQNIAEAEGSDSDPQVKSVSLGVLSVAFGAEGSTGTFMSRIIKSSQGQVYILLKPYLSTIRGYKLRTTGEITTDSTELLTTT